MVPQFGHAKRFAGWVRLLAALLAIWFASQTGQTKAAEGQAWLGEPFGVGRLVIPLPAGSETLVDTQGFQLREARGRIFYPAFRTSGAGELLSGLLGIRGVALGSRLEIWFLFRGDEPLDLTWVAPTPQRQLLVPAAIDPADQRSLLQVWQREFVASLREAAEEDPALLPVEAYLNATLATRLDLPWPTATAGQAVAAAADEPPLQQSVDLLLGRSRLRQQLLLARLQEAETEQATLNPPANLLWERPAAAAEAVPDGAANRSKPGQPAAGTAIRSNQPAADSPSPIRGAAAAQPAAAQPAAVQAPAAAPRAAQPAATKALAAEPAIEPLARYVPADCFYIRFGSFRNYLWFTDLSDEYGGNLARMVTLEARETNVTERLESQLALKKSILADLIGPQVIADVALIGRDLFLEDGAAVGMLFQARNSFALGTDIQRQRQTALAAEREQGATLEEVTIAGRAVSYLSTPDNRLRSFYAVEAPYHLVCTSRRMVEQFFAAAGGTGSLADSSAFQQIRQKRPLGIEDTLFTYFSPEFFAQLWSPQYQIEVRRRLEAAVDMELVALARLAARGEGQPSETLEELTAGGFLPQGFGKRADGSGVILSATGALDSLRGARGYFTPVPDVQIEGVTPSESRRYAELAAFQQQSWSSMDPVLLALRRGNPDAAGIEQLELDALVAPLVEEKYGRWLSMLGSATGTRITMPPDQLVSFQISLRGGEVAPDIAPHLLFVGLEDAATPFRGEPRGILQWIQLLRNTPGYLGSWPALGLLDWLPLRGQRREAGNGFTRLPLGVWRWQGRDFSLLSFDTGVLQRAAAVVAPEATDQRAQARLQVRDLTQSQLGGWVSRLEYARARRASQSNVRFANTLIHQFHVPSAEAWRESENLLTARLVCTLGGDYVYGAAEGEEGSWRSTAWESAQVPDAYRAPLLDWFRGLESELSKQDGQLYLHAKLRMQRQQPAAGGGKSWLDLFNFPRPPANRSGGTTETDPPRP